MNHPSGFRLQHGKAVDVHPFKALFENSYFWHELIHMYLAGYIVTGFLLAGAYAVLRLRGRWGRYEQTALAIPLTVAALAAPVQVLVGDWNGREVARYQPTKLAAFEGLPQTTTGAPIHVLGWYSGGRVEYGIGVPKLLSVLAYHRVNAKVQGLDAVPARDRPPVNVVRFAFQTMVGIGTLLALLGFVYIAVRIRRRRLPRSTWFYRALALAGPLSVVALISGWVTTEVGRQPWVVYRVMRTSQAVTGARGIPVGSGFWQLTAGKGRQAQAVREHAHAAMAPVWEANHVWLIFVLTVVWTAYPIAFGSIASTLSIPLFIAAVGIIFRGIAYALRAGAAGPRELSAIDTVFSISSVLTPFALGTAVGGIASGRVPVGNAAGSQFSSWLNPTSLLVGVPAVTTAAYLAAVFLCADATRVGDQGLEEQFRRRALGAGIVAGVIAVA